VVRRGQDIGEDALRLGAHVYVDTDEQHAAKALMLTIESGAEN
jgi:hypothetical protein